MHKLRLVVSIIMIRVLRLRLVSNRLVVHGLRVEVHALMVDILRLVVHTFMVDVLCRFVVMRALVVDILWFMTFRIVAHVLG